MSAAEQVGQAAAARILAAMTAQGVLQEHLAEATGIPRETLSRKLKRKPETLSLADIALIAEALARPFEELAWGIEVAA